MSSSLPSISSRYRIEREIGRGGMGSVYLGSDTILDRRVAIKLLNSAHLDAPSAIPRFIQEGRVCAQLRSDNSVKIFDLGVNERGQPYLVMELLEGRDLAQELKQYQRMPVQQAASDILQACSALAEAHQLGIVHRDLKPHNLFVTTGARGERLVKVLDFGLSRLPKNTALTASGELLGTPAYMSPEQVEGRTDVDARADVWSIGVILYELVSGVRPFAAETIPHTTHRILYDNPPPLASVAHGVPPAFDALVARCMQKNPAARYRSIDELVRDLSAVAGQAFAAPLGLSQAPPAPGYGPPVANYGNAASAYPFAAHAGTGDVSIAAFSRSGASQTAAMGNKKGTSIFLVGAILGVGFVALAGLGVGGYFYFFDEADSKAAAAPKAGGTAAQGTANGSLANGQRGNAAAPAAPGVLPAIITADAGRGTAPAPGSADAGGGGVAIVDAGSPSPPSAGKVVWATSVNYQGGFTEANIHQKVDGAIVGCMTSLQSRLEATHPEWKKGAVVSIDYDLDGTILSVGAYNTQTVLADVMNPCLKSSLKGKTFGMPLKDAKYHHVSVQVYGK